MGEGHSIDFIGEPEMAVKQKGEQNDEVRRQMGEQTGEDGGQSWVVCYVERIEFIFPGETHTEPLDPCKKLPSENLSDLPEKKQIYGQIFCTFSLSETATGVWERAWHEERQQNQIWNSCLSESLLPKQCDFQHCKIIPDISFHFIDSEKILF